MEELYCYRAELLAALEGVVSELAKVAASLPTSQWYSPIDTAGHTPHYILFHLREQVLHVFTAQLPRFLTEDLLTLPSFEDEDWMVRHYRPEEPPSAILGELTQLIQQELAWLRNLVPADWSRSARHPWWGLHTLQWWVELQMDYSYQQLKRLSAVLGN